MPDFFGVYDRLKTWEYLDFYARCYGFSYQERMRMIDQLLELVRLSDKRDSYVDVLSRGMKQRLCLAHALIHDPRLGHGSARPRRNEGHPAEPEGHGQNRADFLAHSAGAV